MFSKSSNERIAKADPRLQKMCRELEVLYPDLQISCSVRGESGQNNALIGGFSRAHFGESPHNYEPSLAVDFVFVSKGVADWTAKRYVDLANYVRVKYPEIQCGAFFKSFKDNPHVEISGWKMINDKKLYRG